MQSGLAPPAVISNPDITQWLAMVVYVDSCGAVMVALGIEMMTHTQLVTSHEWMIAPDWSDTESEQSCAWSFVAGCEDPDV